MAKVKAQQALEKRLDEERLKDASPALRLTYLKKKLALKQFEVEERIYAGNHDDEYCADFGTLAANAANPKFFESFDWKRFEYVAPSRKQLDLIDREQTVMIREKDFDDRGLKGTIYVNGRVEVEIKPK